MGCVNIPVAPSLLHNLDCFSVDNKMMVDASINCIKMIPVGCNPHKMQFHPSRFACVPATADKLFKLLTRLLVDISRLSIIGQTGRHPLFKACQSLIAIGQRHIMICAGVICVEQPRHFTDNGVNIACVVFQICRCSAGAARHPDHRAVVCTNLHNSARHDPDILAYDKFHIFLSFFVVSLAIDELPHKGH